MNNPKHPTIMNLLIRVAPIRTATLLLLLVSSAQLLLSEEPGDQKNRLDVSYRAGFNISVSLKNVGKPSFPNNPSVTGASYQDGFVGIDDTGNALDLTTYWGYSSTEKQVVGDSLLMRSSQSGTYAKDLDDDPQNGLELRYARELGRTKRLTWGAEAAFNYTALDFRNNRVAPSGIVAVDAFSLGGITPPPATPDDPYIGPAVAGPGAPLLGATPTRLPVTLASDFEADVFGFRFGPYAEISLSDRIAVSVSAGFALLVMDSTFKYRESVTAPGGGVVSSADSSSNADWVPGGYAAAQVSIKVSKSVKVFTGLQFQAADSYCHRTGDKVADVDFGESIFFVVGLGHTF